MLSTLSLFHMATMLWDVCECLGPPTSLPDSRTHGQATIVQASQDYAGLAWVRYDSAFRHQAALTGLTQWLAINPTLYTLCFAGSAWTATRCELCFAATHTTKECRQQGDPDPGVRDRLWAIERAVLSMTPRPQPKPPPPPWAAGQQWAPSGEVCLNRNVNWCSFPYCRHSYICNSCSGGGHPVSSCTLKPLLQPPQRGPAPGSKPTQRHTPSDISQKLALSITGRAGNSEGQG